MLCTYSSLEKEKLEAIERLEREMGKTLLAFSCTDINADSLEEAELSQIKDMEKKLGVAIVAVK